MRSVRGFVVLVSIAVIAAACTGTTSTADGTGPPVSGSPAATGLDKLQHLIFIVQENRSFDQYFGTYPGADGIPTDSNGIPTVCNPDPYDGQCVKPYHDPNDL